MRNKTCLLLAGLILSVKASGQTWTLLNTQTQRDLYSVRNLGSNVLAVPGDSGLLIHYTPTTGNWTRIQLPGTSPVVSAEQVRYPGNQWKNLIINREGKLFRLDDNSVDPIPDSLPEMPGPGRKILSFSNLNISGANEIRYSITCDSGFVLGYKSPYPTARFEIQFPTTGSVRPLYPFNTWNLLAIGDSGKIWRTVGLADDFSSVNQNLTRQNLNRSFGRQTNEIWVAEDSGTLIRSTNGGQAWSRVVVPTVEFLLGGVVSHSGIWVCGSNGLILKTTDSGQSWTPEDSGTEEDLHDIQWFQGSLFAAGKRGTLLQRILLSSEKPDVKREKSLVNAIGQQIRLENPGDQWVLFRIYSLTGKIIGQKSLPPKGKDDFRVSTSGILLIEILPENQPPIHKKVWLNP